MKRIFIPVVVALLVACNSSKENKPVETETAAPSAVIVTDSVKAMAGKSEEKVDGVSGATQIDRVSFNGTLVIPPQYFATVTLTMGGIVKSTSLLPGMYVKKGTVLATLENLEFITLQQTYLDSYAQTEYLKAEYNRQQNLAKEEVASQKKLQQTKADYESMESRLQASAAQLSLLGVNPEGLQKSGIFPYLEVKSPLNGYVGNLQMNLGKHVAAGEPLCDVIDKNKMLLRLTTYEKDLADIQLGSQVDFIVNGLGKKVFRAKLISIGQEVDEVSRSLEVYAEVEQSDPLFRPGMYVTAQIGRNEK